MMLELPLMVTRLSNWLVGRKISTTTAKSIAGVAIAAFEVVIVTPTERLKVWLMTKGRAEQNIRYFFKHSQSLLRGLQLVFFKQTLSWVTFLGTDELMKQILRKRRGLRDTETLPFLELLSISVLVGIINTTFVMPLDFLKTRVQREGSQDPHRGTQILSLAGRIYKSEGVGIFYSGWRVRVVHYFLQSTLTVKLYDVL